MKTDKLVKLFTKGYILLGIGAISFITISIMAYVIGDPKSITSDKNAIGVQKGYMTYIEKPKYDLYMKTVQIIHAIGFICTALGTVIYLKSKSGRRTASSMREKY